MAGTGMLQRGPMEPQPNGGASMPEPSSQDAEEQANVSPEEQQAYNTFVVNGMKMIFNDRTTPKIVARLKSSQNPVEALASTTVMIVTRLKDHAERNGMPLSPEILMHGGLELMGNIAELSQAAKIHTYTDDEIEAATYAAMDQYGTREMQKGTLDKQGIARDFQQILEADRAGKIDEVLPGITEYAKKIGGRPMARKE